MTATIAQRISNDTLSEANAWFQPPKLPFPEIDVSSEDFKSRIHRVLVADRYSGEIPETVLPERERTKVGGNRTVTISRQIDDAISSAFPSAPWAPTISLQALQEWEGHVTAIDDETFTGRLVDVTARRKIEEEEADFPIGDLSDDDRELLALGAVFRWVIGYQRSQGGTKRRVSQITFRRLPAWTRKDLVQAKQTAKELSREISWE